MEIKDMLFFVATTTTIILSIVTIVILFITYNNKRRIENERQQMQYSEMRNYYESQMYEINKKLAADPLRWADSNHLVLSGNETSINSSNINANTTLTSNFLLNHGLSKDDLIVDKKSVFVLTSFIEAEMTVYKELKSICESVGLKCSRSDEEYISGDILPHILRRISQARLIIANLDGRNPNVYYELGIAHALDKPTILISKSDNNIPFDLSSKNIIIYENYSTLRKKLTTELTRTIINH
ncbi:hypothetical protein [Peribacillus sp. SCS-37]|uniref:hypothetical protein n=1 Tax=Paraperibacillus esterisolvens TaxID=3115296 RepID=UPI00390674EA